MGRKCSVKGCLSDSNREEDTGVTFHKVPLQPDARSEWLNLCRISEEKKSIKVIHVCSRHFLRADFCSFKGKKYMLRHGVFPSVFPWDKSKLEAIKSEKQLMSTQAASGSLADIEKVVEARMDTVSMSSNTSKTISPSTSKEINKEPISIDPIDFFTDNQITALDFNSKWCPAKILEVDEGENEALIHFESTGNEYDEWICMDSPRLKPFGWNDSSQTVNQLPSTTIDVAPEISKSKIDIEKDILEENTPLKYRYGERCFAYWSGQKKYPATITKVLENDMYEVLFDDEYVELLKWDKIVKINSPNIPSSQLFDPVQGTKQERREKKRKINVAELFGIGKRQRTESSPNSPKIKATTSQLSEDTTPRNCEFDQTSLEQIKEEPWYPRWSDGHPIGTESQLEFHDGIKKSVIVADPRLPEGWTKHLMKRRIQSVGVSKWETIIVSPDGKKLRSKTEVRNYLESTKLMAFDDKIFDFRMYPTRQKKSVQPVEQKKNSEVKLVPVKDDPIDADVTIEEPERLLKIPLVDDAYKCPIEGCGKTFRKENLAQMHVKHYHPEFSKFLDTTPNVADLAYARTVGDSLDKSPTPSKPIRPKNVAPKINSTNSSVVEESELNSPATPMLSKTKDSEIIKLLNAKPYDAKNEREALPSGLPPSMYPEIKLKDLLSKSEGVPQKDDFDLKTLGITKPSVGIKTLLPVRKAEIKEEEDISQDATPKIKFKSTGKRKKNLVEHLEPEKMAEPKEELPIQHTVNQTDTSVLPEINNVIMEGGELIKIVRMKQEEIINCTCGFTEEDGLMIQCELCLCWQHAYCNNIQKESEVPDKYVCYICQHPLRQRSSRRFFHDQDWLKQGLLPVASYHSKDEELLQKRFERLKKAHDISGGLVELQDFVNTLKVKQKIVKAKNHPKLYLWSKPWEKLPLPEKLEEEVENVIKEESKANFSDNEDENQLNKDLKNMFDSSQHQVPIIPQPEAAIETADCKLNLLDHILHSQNLVMERLDDFEKELDKLEEGITHLEKDDNYPRTRQTLQMLMRDLNKLEELSQNTSI